MGGEDRKIVVYSRETSSGTYEFFKESVLKHRNDMPAVLSMPATGAIIQSVSQTPGAIGYVGLAYLNPEVKALAVSYDGEAGATSPRRSTMPGRKATPSSGRSTSIIRNRTRPPSGRWSTT